MADMVELTKELNDLREKVLAGEEVPPEKYHEVLLAVRKLRRDRPEKSDGKASKAPVDVAGLLFGRTGGSDAGTP